MKKNSNGLIVWIFVILLFFLPEICSYTTEEGDSANDYARIIDMDYKAVVVDEPESRGKIVVTERFTFDVHAASQYNGFWELWRDLCEDQVDGVNVYYKVNSVKQIMPDGTAIPWEESDKLYWSDWDYVPENTEYGPEKWFHSPGPYNEEYDLYECVFFYVNDLYREKITFEIEYEMYNAVLRYNDCADLYVSMFSEDSVNHLESFNAEFLIPEDKMPDEGNYKVATYGTDAGSFAVEESATKNPGYYTFSIDLDEDELNFSPYNEYIEFEIVSFGEDKHIFSEHASVNDYYYDDVLDEVFEEQEYYMNAPQRYKTMKMVAFGICMAISALIIISNISTISKLKKRCPELEKNPEPFRDIPSDLDPKFAAALVFSRDKKNEDESGVYSSLLLSLARKGYIKLEESYGDDVTIEVVERKRVEEPVEITNPIAMTIKCDYCGFVFNTNEHSTCPICNGSYQNDQEYQNNIEFDKIQSELNESQSASVFIEPDPTFNISDLNWGSEPAATSFDTVTEPVVEEIIEEREPLTNCEEYYLNLIKRHAVNGRISMETLQDRISTDYDYTNSFVRNIQKSVVDNGVSLGYFQKANYLEPMKRLTASASTYSVWGIIILIGANVISYQTPVGFAFGGYTILALVCLILGLFLKSQAGKYILLTEKGAEEYNKWRGLYNFLKSDTLINERTVVELPLWERYLVYATAFGISEKVIEAIKIRCPEVTAAATTSIVHSNYCRSGRIRTSGRRFHSSVRRGSYGHSSSGGFGYGGGGRGGGGGGGGH